MEDRIKHIPIIIIAGPTATGKSKLAVELADELKSEVISCDSMQVYKNLDIATAKIKEKDMCGIKHHMLDIVTANTEYTVERYISEVKPIIEEINRKGKIPIICGGTGLYITSLLEGINFDSHPYSRDLRATIEKEYDRDNGATIYSQLKGKDPIQASKIHVNDRKRVVRATEILRTTETIPSIINKLSKGISPYISYTIVLTVSNRQKLYSDIDYRVETMMEEGLLNEAEFVYINREEFITASQIIGYKEFFPYFEGKSDLLGCVEILKRSSRQYAKRQITWFKKLPDAVFVDTQNINISSLVEEAENKFMYETD